MDPYVPGSYLNASNTTYKESSWADVGETMNEDADAPDLAEDIPYRDSNWIDAALMMNAGSTAPDFGAGNPEPYQRVDFSPSFSLVNLQVGKTFLERLEIYAGVENLFDFVQLFAE